MNDAAYPEAHGHEDHAEHGDQGEQAVEAAKQKPVDPGPRERECCEGDYSEGDREQLVPSVGYSVFNVQPGANPETPSQLRVSNNELENEYYRVKINSDGSMTVPKCEVIS